MLLKSAGLLHVPMQLCQPWMPIACDIGVQLAVFIELLHTVLGKRVCAAVGCFMLTACDTNGGVCLPEQ